MTLASQIIAGFAAVATAIKSDRASIATKAPTSRLISTAARLTGGGDLSADRTLDLATANSAPGTFSNASVTVDQYGRVTAASSGSSTVSSSTLTQTVMNSTGATIPKGSVVYFNNNMALSQIPTVSLAIATAPASTVGAGIVMADIANGSTGSIMVEGLLTGINTLALTAGSAVYISAATAGGVTNTAPSAPNYRYRIGWCTINSGTLGAIYITPSTGSLGNGAANQIEGMNAAGTAKEAKTITPTTDLSVVHTANTITIGLSSATAAKLATNAFGFTEAVKTATAVYANTTLTADSELTLALAASTIYQVDISIFYRATAANDLKVGAILPTGTTFDGAFDALASTATSNASQASQPRQFAPFHLTASGQMGLAGGQTSTDGTTTPTENVLRVTGRIVTGSTAGNITLTFAENSATDTGANATSRILAASRIALIPKQSTSSGTGPTIIATETYPTTSASSWGTNWVTRQQTNGPGTSAVTTAGVGTITPAGGNYQGSTDVWSGKVPFTTTNQGLQFEFMFDSLNEFYIQANVRVPNDTAAPQAGGYNLSIYPSGGGYSIAYADGYGSGGGEVDFTMPSGWVANTWYAGYIEVYGNSVRAACWLSSGTKPASPQVTTTMTNYSAGSASLGANSGYSNVGKASFRNVQSYVPLADAGGSGSTTPATSVGATNMADAVNAKSAAGRSWSTSYSNDFLTDAAIGAIRTAYPNMGYAAENEGDTTNGVKSANKTISVSSSVLDVYQHMENGTRYGAFIMPDNYAPHTGVWYTIRMRATGLTAAGGDQYKFVALMWPSSDDWSDGEIDWPEQDLNGAPRPASASVPPTVKSGTTDQRAFYPTTEHPAQYTYDSGWHTYDLIWIPTTDATNKGIYCYQDGVLVWKITEDAGNPVKPMRVTLQAETSTSNYNGVAADTGHTQIDWVVIRDLA